MIGALDIATTTGLCTVEGEAFFPTAFRSGEKRPFGLKKGEIDFAFEGRIFRQFRDHIRTWIVENGITDLGIERPLQSNVTIKKPIYDTSSKWAGTAVTYKEVGGTTMGTIFRIYGLVAAAVEISARLGVSVHMISQGEWRSAFLGVTRAPKGTKDGTIWLKNKAIDQCRLIGLNDLTADMADSVGICWTLRAKLNPRLAGHADDLFRKAKA